MTRRLLVQTVATAAIAAVAGLAVATPVAAAPAPWRTATTLDYTDPVYLSVPSAAEFPVKGCESVPGGTSATADGWVFNQPAPDARGYRYVMTFRDTTNAYINVALDDEGAAGLVQGAQGGGEWAAESDWYEGP